MKEIKAYKCDHCGKLYQTTHHCTNHEENKCTSNPKNWDKCIDCIFSKQYKGLVISSIQNDDDEYFDIQVTKYKCEKLNKEMYPFKAKSKGYVNRYADSFHGVEQMPNECEHFVSCIGNGRGSIHSSTNFGNLDAFGNNINEVIW